MLDEAQKVAVSAKVGWVRIDGSTSHADRHAAVGRFQSDPNTRLAVLSIKAAGQVSQTIVYPPPRRACSMRVGGVSHMARMAGADADRSQYGGLC